ncbi:MAG TPA: hypothetical protein VFC05_00355 [Nitrososphaeraceae archaeon]|nr:hypothetical protein [Nitrososphaeraceae archaeon]
MLPSSKEKTNIDEIDIESIIREMDDSIYLQEIIRNKKKER